MASAKSPRFLDVYASFGVLLISSSFYYAYHLTEPMFHLDGTTPGIDFLVTSLPVLIGPGLFPTVGIVFVFIPCALSWSAVRISKRLNPLPSAIVMSFLLAFSSATVYTLIPFSIGSSVMLGTLTAVVVVISVFRRVVVNPNLPPDRLGRTPIKSMEIARARWQWLLRQSVWLSVTILVTQAFQSILSFQNLLSSAIPPVNVSPYPLDFFRYQVVISFGTFAYLLVGVILFATIFCYDQIVRIEEKELEWRLEKEKNPHG